MTTTAEQFAEVSRFFLKVARALAKRRNVECSAITFAEILIELDRQRELRKRFDELSREILQRTQQALLCPQGPRDDKISALDETLEQVKTKLIFDLYENTK